MGIFLSDEVLLKQSKVNPKKWITENLTRFASTFMGIHEVPVGFLTDGYTKPMYTHPLVGGNFSDDVRPAVLHDWLCFRKELTFKQANDMFYEAMRAVSIPLWKCIIMRWAVNFNPDKW